MDLALNNLKRLICHKTHLNNNQPTNQPAQQQNFVLTPKNNGEKDQINI